MRARVLSSRAIPLSAGWELRAVEPGLGAEAPSQIDDGTWLAAEVPGTVASALSQAGTWSWSSPPDLDAQDWWFRCRFSYDQAGEVKSAALRFEGLATLTEVFLNGERILGSDNMFLAHAVDVASRLRASNTLHLRFRSLNTALAVKRPRPRWRSRLVDNQGLRWQRTTPLGRMPGWSPPAHPVGPWRPIVLEEHPRFEVESASVASRLDGADGIVQAKVLLKVHAGARPELATLRVGDAHVRLECRPEGASGLRIEGQLRVPHAERWWPHTHGAQTRYPARLDVGGDTIDLGRIGFREIDLHREAGNFQLRLNGVPVFCRGACWTPLDILRLASTPDVCREALLTVKAAGMNMLRVGGTMVYESDAFYDLCDELGILVWQDFMFANLDYPVDDPDFARSIAAEAEQLLRRLAGRPSLAVLCGSSEVEQQAAMLGLPAACWTNDFFASRLPSLCHTIIPDVSYVPSSPSGGALPMRVSEGAAHYYGVGAYLRPLDDARRAGVRFASECLAFANVPEERTVERFLADGQAPFHHPAWKARVPRDHGASWDFEDVRDHYLEALYRVNPRELRSRDMERYLALSRVVTGEVMARTLAEWRRPGSTCNGALIWFHRDLWPGAGWGVVDSTGLPKAAYYYLKRTLQPVALLISDEDLDGLRLHAINETQAAIDAHLEVRLFREGELKVAEARTDVSIPARGTHTTDVEVMLGRFVDASYAYRFGPAGHDLVVASLIDSNSGARLSEAFHFPLGLGADREGDVGLVATASAACEGASVLQLTTRRFAQSVAIACDGRPDDNYFHLAPGASRTVRVTHDGPALRGTLRALNATASVRITCDSTGAQ